VCSSDLVRDGERILGHWYGRLTSIAIAVRVNRRYLQNHAGGCLGPPLKLCNSAGMRLAKFC